MAVSADCPKCQYRLKVRDEYAGRKIKCPKCQTVVQLPTAGAAAKRPAPAAAASGNRGQAATSSRPRHNPLLDLLDEAGVEAAPRGDVCPSCASEMKQEQVLCLECGFHRDLGKKMETAILIDEREEIEDDGRSDAEKRMAKAERDIEDMPIGEYGQDFGDGNESFLIALVAMVALALFLAGGVTLVLSMDFVTQYISSQAISLIASVIMAAISIFWIAGVAFRINPAHGAACLLTGGLYCIPFGFMQGKALFLPAIILSASIVIGLASGYFVLYPPEDDDAMIRSLNYAMQFARYKGLC